MKPRTFLTGASGNLARVVTPVLHGAGVPLTLGSRRRPDAVPEGAEYAAIDFGDRQGLARALAGHEVLVLISPVVEDEVALVANALDAAREAGVTKVVAIGIMNEASRAQVPHFRNKQLIAEAIADSGLTWVILKPNLFFQNDYMVLAPLTEHGIYAQPIGSAGMQAVDTRDIADAVLRTITTDAFDNRAIPLCGPDLCSGPANAATWSEALGREIAYAGDDLTAFVAGIRSAFASTVDEWLVDDLSIMMRVNQAEGNPATPDDLAACEAVLGRPPRRYADFVREVAATL